MHCRSSKKSAAMDCPLFLGPRFSKTVLVERCRKKSHWKNGDCRTPLADRFWDELGKAISYRSALEDFGEKNEEKGSWGVLGAEDGKHEKTVCGKRAKYVTHKGSNAFPEEATTAEHHWQIDFGRGSGEAISYRSALEDFGKKNQEESRKGSSAF